MKFRLITIENPVNEKNSNIKFNPFFKHTDKEINYLTQYFTLIGDNLY